MINKKNLYRLCLGLLFNTVILSTSHAYDPLGLLNSLVKSSSNHSSQPIPSVAYNTPVTRNVVYNGYSKDFQRIKNLINTDQWAQAYLLQEQLVKRSDPAEFLQSSEAALLALDTNKISNAINHLAAAEQSLKNQAEKSFLEDGASSVGLEFLSLITGKGDFTEYTGAPFERILMLNYKSIGYLLNGERKAYNVTRRAIDWQNIEQKEFEKSIDSAKQKIIEEELKINTQKPEHTANSGNIFSVISQQYKSSEKTAMSVASAYVNPFGFYMAGIVQEFDGYADVSLRDNARISYKKALKLNPKSKVLKQAVKEIKRRVRRNRRLVQVVIADGFAPEKKTLQFGIPMPGGIVPVKLPIYEPVTSQVAHIKIKSGRKTLATLSTVANIEAIVLRHQLDSLPLEHFKVVASIARSTAENILWGQLGALGQVGKGFRESLANPDMRSWLTLPKQLLAARFYASKRLKTITIVSYDKRWRRLATKKVTLPKNKHSFIYARTIDNLLYANVNKTLWVN